MYYISHFNIHANSLFASLPSDCFSSLVCLAEFPDQWMLQTIFWELLHQRASNWLPIRLFQLILTHGRHQHKIGGLEKKQSLFDFFPCGSKSMVLHDYSSFQLPIYFFSLQPLSKGAGREVGNSFPPLLFFVCLTILVQSPNPAHASESGLFIKLLYLNSFLYHLRILSNLKCISYEKLFITCKRVFIFQRERVLNI